MDNCCCVRAVPQLATTSPRPLRLDNDRVHVYFPEMYPSSSERPPFAAG